MTFASQASSDDHRRIRQGAILLLAIGEDQAARAVHRLWPRDVQRLGGAMAALGMVSARQMDAVLAAFLEAVGRDPQRDMGADDYLKNVLEGAPAPNRRPSWRELMFSRSHSRLRGTDGLKWMTAAAIARCMRRQPPRLQAMALAYLEPERAARVIAAYSLADRCQVLVELAAASANATAESPRRHAPARAELGGAPAVAAILRRLEPEARGELLTGIGVEQPMLAAALQRLLLDSQTGLIA